MRELCFALFVKQAYPVFGTFVFHQDPQVLLHHTVLPLAKRQRSVSVGHTCGYLDFQSVQHPLVPPGITPYAHIFIWVHLFGCPIRFEPLFNQNFYSLVPW